MARLNQISILLSLIIFVSCSTKSDQEYFDSAKKYIEDKNFADAVVELEEMIEEYPESNLIPEATLELGKIYHAKTIKTISANESLKKAVKYYLEVFNKYPDLKDAPNALFMAGFIQANELANFDEARDLYNLFLEKYPDNELAVSANYELQNLGKSPEDILKENNTEAK